MPKNEPTLAPTRAQLRILLALADGERHGYAIMREVEAESGGRMRLGPGTLYGAIKSLLAAKLIVETDSRVDPEVSDERRRYYELTDAGRRILGVEMRSMAEMVKLGRERRVLAGAGR